MPRRSPRWIWAGRVVFGVLTCALVVYFVVVQLQKANMIASCVAAVVALLALGAPYLLPAPSAAEPDAEHVEDSGRAKVTTGADLTGDGRPVRVIRSGNATADGPGSIATTGVVHRSSPKP
jgi:hypothetical protein